MFTEACSNDAAHNSAFEFTNERHLHNYNMHACVIKVNV